MVFNTVEHTGHILHTMHVKGDFLSATAAVKSRVERFNNGEWKELWDDAHGHHELDRFSVQRSAAAGKAAKFNRAKHYALQAQF